MEHSVDWMSIERTVECATDGEVKRVGQGKCPSDPGEMEPLIREASKIAPTIGRS